jgi:hypothetical protein
MSGETTKAYIKDIAIRLNDPTIYGGASLMIGAGFSKNAEGIGNRNTPPDWSELAEAMYDELYPKPSESAEISKWEQQRIIKTSGKNTLRLAEEYIAFFDRNKMNSLIEKNVADEMFIPGELHKRLLRLNWTDIFTTNYDTLLERTREDIFPDKDYKIVLSQDNLPGSGGGTARIIKLHGSIPAVRPYVISEEDFRCYPRISAAFVNTVQQALIETTLCMVGFSGDDPNFLSWHGWIQDNLGDNCPQIYLIGLFNDMNESEKDIFRKRKIALVDLTDLLDGSEKDRYGEAYSKFINLIENEGKKDSFRENAPYYEEDEFFDKWEPENEGKYIKEIMNFSDKILNQIGDVVLLPEKERSEYRNYFSGKFRRILLKCTTINEELLHTITNLIKLQRYCLIPLYDNQANKLIELCTTVKEKGIRVSTDLIMQIYLYILEMYRIDSDENMYQVVVSACEEIQGNLSDVSLGMYHLELAKHAASLFDADEVKKQLETIGKTNLKIEIAKAGLYVQLGENEQAESILKECLNNLRNLKMDTAFNASYKSYLSLCYNSLNKWWNLDDDYSDHEYKGNEFQTRRIILELEDALREEILMNSVKDETRENVFEVNFNKGKTITIGEKKIKTLSFEFILMLDTLCLPLFSDQSRLIPDAMKNIMETSKNTYWKSSFMIRANNKEVIERILSRRSIAMTDRDMLVELYKRIWECVKKTTYKNFDSRNAFLSHSNALNVLSRMVVFLDDESIVNLMKHIVMIKLKKDDYCISDLKGIVSRLSTRFNGKVAESLLNEIFTDADSRLQLAVYFTQMDFEITDSEKYYGGAIALIQDKDQCKRDNGIAQLLCLWKNSPKDAYKTQIAELLWNGDLKKFPSSKMFYEMIWEELPHPDNVNFVQLYSDFIYNGLIKSIGHQDIFRYVNLYYLTSPISDGKYTKCDLDNKQLEEILVAIEGELEKDKEANTGIEFLGVGNEKQQIKYIGEFIAMLYVLKEGKDAVELRKHIENIQQKIKEKGASCNAMEAIQCAINSDFSMALDMLKPAFWSNNENAIAEASLGFQLILFWGKKNNQDLSLVKGATLEVMDKLQYSDIKYVKSIWNLLRPIILKVLSDDESMQSRIAEIYKNCIQSYSYNGLKGDKYYFEAMYNCNKTLKCHIDKIKSNGIEVRKELNDVVEYIKSFNIPELLSI